MNKFLFKQIDNSSLIIFRIIFGLLIFLESVGAIFTGWIKRTLIDPEFTFTVIGFEWLQPLPGNGMYFYYLLWEFWVICDDWLQIPMEHDIIYHTLDSNLFNAKSIL